ncbi:MAG: hypothetical protein HC916_02500 [Coleofasciculaceae cyanobacterium SM2_1_6]|nr:hypothetical protein [Coleofasciculaceae cyanobacterium SM2_1_6]
MELALLLLLLGIYGYGVWTFWRGFERTSFNASLPNKLLLSSLWPVLLVVNKSYRQNFTKALKGR